MQRITLIKWAANVAVGTGVGKIVKDIIVNNTNAPEGLVEKTTVYVGAAVIGMMAKDATKAYTGNKIDTMLARLEKFVSEAEDDQEESPVSQTEAP